MNLDELLSEVLEVTCSFNPEIALFLFLLCAIGEVGFTLPYILETNWLMAGYQMGQGKITPLEVFSIWLIAQAGRQTGSIALYYSSLLGMIPLRKFYRKYIASLLAGRQVIPQAFLNRLTNPSPFSVAAGRLIGLRIPAACTTSARHKLSCLALGVVLSSIVWDGLYLLIGHTVRLAFVPSPLNMFLYSLAGLTCLYLGSLGIRFLLRRYNRVKTAH